MRISAAQKSHHLLENKFYKLRIITNSISITNYPTNESDSQLQGKSKHLYVVKTSGQWLIYRNRTIRIIFGSSSENFSSFFFLLYVNPKPSFVNSRFVQEY